MPLNEISAESEILCFMSKHKWESFNQSFGTYDLKQNETNSCSMS